MLIVVGFLLLAGIWAHQMAGPLTVAHTPAISLSPAALPGYTLRTVAGMFAALLASIAFTFVYATAAERRRRTKRVLIPLLDVLQSVPILGYLSFTVLFFLSLFPRGILGAECAAIFSLFTGQAWNMTFSLYQALRTVPLDLDEASRSFRLSAWQRFWRLNVPFAMPGLVWNAMMSMSGGWFFVVASEAIAVGILHVDLPGVGAYVSQAFASRDLDAVGWAIVAMSVAIVLYDQLLFRPLVAWSERFRYGDAAPTVASRSWMLDLLHRSRWVARMSGQVRALLHRAARAATRVYVGMARPDRVAEAHGRGTLVRAVQRGMHVCDVRIDPSRTRDADLDGPARRGRRKGGLTSARVTVLVMLASAIWVSIGIAIGLRPGEAARIQPVTQFLAGFPANLLFPVAVFAIVRLRLEPRHLATTADDIGRAMVCAVQRDRRCERVPGRLARSGGMLPGAAYHVVASRHAAGCPTVFRDGRDYRVGRRMEREHRCRSGELG